MDDYKISLGVDVDVSDIQSQINSKATKIDKIPIKLEIENLKEIKKQIQSLGDTKANKGLLTFNTESLEASLKDVSTAIKDIKASIGTLDSGSGMKSLLSSINQISNALEKASNQFDGLNKSLNALSGKDLSLNFGINLGSSNSVARNAVYGSKVRNETLPHLKQQMSDLVKYYNTTYKQSLNEFEALQKLVSGTKLSNGDFFENFLFGKDSVASRMNGGSLASQMQAYKQYIDMFKQAASLKGLDLSSVTSSFSKSADDLIKDAQDIQTGAKEMEDSFEKLKQVFGGGNNLNVDGISAQLDSIVVDLGEIKTAIQGLSSNNTIDGLTQSFNRLSETLEKLTANLTLAKNTLDTDFSNTVPANNAVKAAQQTGQKIGETISKSAKQSINIDDVVEKETRALMKEYGISAKNKTAKDDIKGALTNYVNEIKNGGTIVNDEFFGSFNTADAALRKVTDTIARHKKEVIELDTLYEDLLADIKSVNKGKGATKVRLSDMRAEWGDDYKANKDLLGSWFSDKYTDGIGIDSWVKSKSWSSLLDLSGSHQDIANQLVELVKKAKTKTAYSGDELFKEGFLNIDDVEASVKESAANISAAEQKMAQSSVESANTIVQSQAKQRSAYQETTDELSKAEQRLEEINRSIADSNNRFNEATIAGDEAGMNRALAEMDALETEAEETKAIIESLKTTYQEFLAVQKGSFQRAFSPAGEEFGGINNTAKSVEEYFKSVNGVLADTVSVQERFDADKNLNGFTVSLKNANGAAEQLRYTLRTVEDGAAFFEYTGGSINDNGVLKQMNAISAKADALQNKLDKLKSNYSDQNVSRSIKDDGHIDALSEQYDKVEKAIIGVRNADESTFASMVSNAQREITTLETMVSEFKNAENVASKMKSTDFESGLKIAKNNLDKFKAEAKDFPRIAQTIGELEKSIAGVGDASSLNKFTDQLRVAKSELEKIKAESSSSFDRLKSLAKEINGIEFKLAGLDADKNEAEINELVVSLEKLHREYDELFSATSKNLSGGQMSQLDDIFAKAGDQLRQLDAKIADTKAKLANGIKADIEFGNFENEVDEMYAKFNRLSDANVDLRASVELVENAYKEMLAAANANTGDEVANRERLIQAEKEYAAALEKTNNLIKIQARADRADEAAQRLADNKESLKLDMVNWLQKNTKAAKEYGGEINKLIASLDKLDEVGVKGARRQFNNLDKAAESRGLKGLTLFDQVKEKFKEYSAYFSVAEVFMYAEQALREMFNTVKEIDTAMTGLYRVTDLTSSQYDTLFNNMISSAKEYGATLNDIINATTDWVRAGFDADTALGLAEVTTMYQHISDLDYDTAAENLITAYNGFKNELNGAFDGDQVAAVNYIADVLNELDNNFAVTSAGLGEALKRSASALDLAGNSIQETAGMVTGIAEVTQDPEKAGKMYARTYSNVWCNYKIA